MSGIHLAQTVLILLLALLIDRVWGDPSWLWKRIMHPVVAFGHLIVFFENRYNGSDRTQRQRFSAGFLTILLLILLAAVAGFLLQLLCLQLSWPGIIIEAILASLFLAQKSLMDHVSDVAKAFETDGLVAAKHAVSMIVGRDPDQLDESGVSRAAIESLAENSSDGVIAPVFWFLIFGLGGLMAYKMLNTADSMIGYKNTRYNDFGRAAAKLDDAANYIPARLTGYLTVITARLLIGKQSAERAYQVMRVDAHHHRSPNAGWPESAYAGALDIQLAGPRLYDGESVDEPFQNIHGKAASHQDIQRSISLFANTMNIMTLCVAILALGLHIIL